MENQPTYYDSTAIIHYNDSTHKVIASIDSGIVQYYFSLIPLYYYVNSQMYPPHITIVRSEPIEQILDFSQWKKWEDKTITYTYSSYVYFSHPYFYLRVQSEEIGEIRRSLGLQTYRFLPGFYHITIGNIKS